MSRTCYPDMRHPYRDLSQPTNSRYFFDDSLYVDLEEVQELTLCDDGEWSLVYRNGVETTYGSEIGPQIFNALKKYRL
jgi:hypothetical protein